MNADVAKNELSSSFKQGLAQRLIQLREFFGVKTSAFAARLGITKSLLHKYEAAEAAPGAEILWKFAQIGVSLDWLIANQGDMLLPSARMPAATAAGPAANNVSQTPEMLVASAVELVEQAFAVTGFADSTLRSFLTSAAFLLLQHGVSGQAVQNLLLKLVQQYQRAFTLAASLNPEETHVLGVMRAASPAQLQILRALIGNMAENGQDERQGSLPR